MTAKQAYKIAAQGKEGALTNCYDIGYAFAFYFDEGDGSPFVIIDKSSGEKSYMHIPPISNIEILENGEPVPIGEIV